MIKPLIRITFILLFLLLNPKVVYASQDTCMCTIEEIIEVTKQYPSLRGREIGEALRDSKGETETWPNVLPFFAQDALDLGFELPKTFGIAIIPNTISQDLTLTDLKVSFNGSDMTAIDFVQFGTARASNDNLQIKADVWLFPFLNLYMTYGKMRGQASAPISIKGKDFLEFVGVDCDGGAFEPKACYRSFNAIAKPNYTGSNFSFGFNLAMGWDRFFVTLPVTYVISDLNILADKIKTLQISPRIGISADAGNWGTISTFIGATYLNAKLSVSGQFNFDTTDVPLLDDNTTLDFIIHQENTDKINYLIGFNWDINKSWSFHSEAGFGGSRESFIASTTYRF